MEQEKHLYTSGEFAKLSGVNKRTLHFYNNIGLLHPEKIGENGYHYYTVYQFAKLQIILTLRQIGISIEEIKTYFNNYSDDSFAKMLLKQKNIINKTIDQLLQIKYFLSIKAEKLELGLSAEDGKIELCTIPERRLILSQPISSKSDEIGFSDASDFLLYLKEKFNIFDSFGSRISLDNVKKERFNSYDCYYAYCTNKKIKPDLILKEGTYLRAFCIGKWDKIPSLYKKIINYADKNNLVLSAYSYEEGLNELSLKEAANYKTMITIHVENL